MSQQQRPPTAQRGGGNQRPPGTASRLSTAMQGQRGQPGQGIALSQQLNVADRPTTQQGLGGLKTGAVGNRVVLDRTYYLGIIRNKLLEINNEVNKIRNDSRNLSTENASYLSYERQAEKLSDELKQMQGEMADYNVLVEKLATESDFADVQREVEDIENENLKEARQLENLFGKKHEQEKLIGSLEAELLDERRKVDGLIETMPQKSRDHYNELKSRDSEYLREMDRYQEQIDKMNATRLVVEKEIDGSTIRQEAVKHLEELEEMRTKLEKARREENERGSPEQQREKLMAQVKADNQDVAALEKQESELLERVDQMREEIAMIEQDIQEGQSERSQKYKEMKRREVQMDDFLNNFESIKAADQQKVREFEERTVSLLEQSSRNLSHFSHLPSLDELRDMKQDLDFKKGETMKSEETSQVLLNDERKLQADLAKIEQLEEKVNNDLFEYREKNVKLEEEIDLYADLDRLKREAEERRQLLSQNRVLFKNRLDSMQSYVKRCVNECESIRMQLEQNDTHQSLKNQEISWQQKEQANHQLREYLASKGGENDYTLAVQKVMDLVAKHNKSLIDQL